MALLAFEIGFLLGLGLGVIIGVLFRCENLRGDSVPKESRSHAA